MTFFDLLGICAIFTGIFAAFEYYEKRESSQSMKTVTIIWSLFILAFSKDILSPWYVLTHGGWFVYACIFHVSLFVGIRLYLGPVRAVQKSRYDARKRVQERLNRERERRLTSEHLKPIPRVVSPFPDLSKSDQEALVSRLMHNLHQKPQEREKS